MDMLVRKSEVYGRVDAPASKSLTHRFLVCASLAEGKSVIRNPLICDDTLATIDALEKLGVCISVDRDRVMVEGDGLKPSKSINCRDSGTTLRFLVGMCSLLEGESFLTGSKRLMQRPIQLLLCALNELGADCKKVTSGISVRGRVKGGDVTMRGDISSQFVSSLLLISPLTEKGVSITLTTELESKPYVMLTIESQKMFDVEVESEEVERFKVRPQSYRHASVEVEGDWSSSSFLLAAGAVAGKVEVTGLNPRSLQADRKIIEVLRRMGARVEIGGSTVTVEKTDEFLPINLDVSDCPDLFPIVCILCSLAKGKSVITGIRRLRLKESDRVKAVATNLRRVGGHVNISGESFVINGGSGNLKPSVVDSFNDHRIAMAFGVMGLVVDGILIRNAECVNKSFPDFWSKLRFLGADADER